MKPPAFQFYPGDWLRDLNLQSCSLRARGLWFEMLCLMHDGTPYGHLADAKGTISGRKLNRLVHANAWEVRRGLKELEDHNVFSRTADGVIFSRRMVRDKAVRDKRAAGGVWSLAHPHVPRPKESIKDRWKDFLEGSPEGYLGGPHAVPSPASASATTKKETTPDSEGATPGPLPDDLSITRNGPEDPGQPESMAQILARREWLRRDRGYAP